MVNLASDESQGKKIYIIFFAVALESSSFQLGVWSESQKITFQIWFVN